MLSPQGKELTPPFKGFTKDDFDKLGRAGGRFTMSVPIGDPHLVAVSAIKSAYLALFSLFGSTCGYDYIGGAALAAVRRLLLARKIRGVFRFRYRHKSPRVVQVQC